MSAHSASSRPPTPALVCHCDPLPLRVLWGPVSPAVFFSVSPWVYCVSEAIASVFFFLLLFYFIFLKIFYFF